MNGDVESESSPETWLRYADSDLLLVTAALNGQRSAGEICSHAQQATEKAFKALLELQQVEVPRIHNLVQLHSLVEASLHVPVSLVRLERLTDLQSEARYPGEWPEPTDEEARWSADVATSVVQAVKEAFGELEEL